MLHRMKDILLLLVNIILFNLHIKHALYNQDLPFNWVCNLNITTILQRWQLIIIRFVTFTLYLSMVFQNHLSIVWTLRSDMSNPQAPKTFYTTVTSRLSFRITFSIHMSLFFSLSMHKGFRLSNHFSLHIEPLSRER